MKYRILFLLLALLLACTKAEFAESQDSLRFCSQNLFRFGDSGRKTSPKKRAKQKSYLVTRMRDARCDVVALQELSGKSEKQAQRLANELAEELSRRTEKRFRAYTGGSRDEYIRNGFLAAEHVGEVRELREYWRERLPKFQALSPPSSFTRGPLAMFIRRPSGQQVAVFAFHLKSKYKGFKDRAGTSFEAQRMQAAERLRRLAKDAAKELGPDAVVLVMGDRNSPPESASSVIVSGRRTIEDFSSQKPCRLTEHLTPNCGTSKPRSRELAGLFELRHSEAPKRYTRGSYRYKGKESIIDEIFVLPQNVARFRRSDSTLAIGFGGKFYRGSDHKLLWAELKAPEVKTAP